jgi:hypothetical protein
LIYCWSSMSFVGWIGDALGVLERAVI